MGTRTKIFTECWGERVNIAKRIAKSSSDFKFPLNFHFIPIPSLPLSLNPTSSLSSISFFLMEHFFWALISLTRMLMPILQAHLREAAFSYLKTVVGGLSRELTLATFHLQEDSNSRDRGSASPGGTRPHCSHFFLISLFLVLPFLLLHPFISAFSLS